MIMDDYDGQMIFGDFEGLKLPDICLSDEEKKNPKKPQPRKLVPTGNRTRARCVASRHATACPTEVDVLFLRFPIMFGENKMHVAQHYVTFSIHS